MSARLRPTIAAARRGLAPLAVAAMAVLGGCGVDEAPVVPLVEVPEGEQAGLALGTGEEARGAAEGAATARGAEGYAGPEDVARFSAECEALQPEPPGDGEAASTEGYGALYRGKKPPPDPGPPPEDGTFVWVEGNAEFLDPNLISESAGTALASQMFETLLVTGPGNGPPVPGAAESYEVSEDGRTYTFHLRAGMVWSDGAPLTARDFAYGWIRGLTPATGSKNAQQLWFIEGARAFNRGETDDPESLGIEVVDDLTLRVTLDNPAPFFPHLVTYIAYAPIPRHAVEAHGEQWIRPGNVVVNGPYVMTEWKPRDRMVMEKNPRYWDADAVSIERSVVRFTDDESRNIRLYQSNQAHWVKPVPSDKIREYIAAGRSDLRIDMQMCTYYYVVRTLRPPFDHPLVRRAIHLAIDKERMTKHILASFQVPATNLVPPMFEDTLGYVPPEGESFDPERARALLADAGHPDGVGLPPLEIVYNTFESHRLIAEFVQRNLQENLGIRVTVNNMEWKSLLKKVHAGDFEIARTSWCADYPDPTTFLTVFHSESANNYAGYDNPAYDDLLDRIARERDTRARNVLMCAAEKVLVRDVPVMPFYFYTVSYLVRPFVKGLEPQYQDHHLLEYMSIEQP
ncbi:MAG: peptide ABC transporter substrate-binding protein [Myxococcota bacterium]